MYYVHVFIIELRIILLSFLSQNPIANQVILLPREFAGTNILISKTSLVLNLSPHLNTSSLHSTKNYIPISFLVVC
jgi:hypothetical protein